MFFNCIKPSAQVYKFYQEIWNKHDLTAIPAVMHENVTFRGSLGDETRGHAGFADYVDKVHTALADYTCVIQDLVEEGDKVFAKVVFTGIHRNTFLGYPPTQKQVTWTGCALFTFDGPRIADLWVLGDLKDLEAQLAQELPRDDLVATS